VECARENLRLDRRIVPNRHAPKRAQEAVKAALEDAISKSALQFTVRVVVAVCVVAFASVPTPVIVMLYVPAGVPPELVVTEIAELCAEFPAESPAATVKLYVVAAVKPVTLKVVEVGVPMDFPFSYTV